MKRTEKATNRGRGGIPTRRWTALVLAAALLLMPFAGRGQEGQSIYDRLVPFITATPGPAGAALTPGEAIGRLRTLWDKSALEEALQAFESQYMEFGGEYAQYAKARLDLLDGDIESAVLRLTELCSRADFVQDIRANRLPAPASLLNYAQARQLEEEGGLADAIALYKSDYVLDGADRLLALRRELNEREYVRAEALEAEGKYAEAAEAFRALGLYRDSADRAEENLALVSPPALTPKPAPTPTPAPKPTLSPVDYCLYEDHVVITGYNGSAGSLMIPAQIMGLPVTRIEDRAFSNCGNLTAVTIPEGVTSIGYAAFSGCSSLTAVTIPEGVTSIGHAAFSGCSSLIAVTLPEGVSGIGNWTFENCSNLTSITIPKGVKSIGMLAFSGCSSLTSVTLPEGVMSIVNSAFSDCSNLASVTLPESVMSIGDDAFYGCRALTAVTIPEGVTSIGYAAFSGCSSLIAVTIPEGVTHIGHDAFYLCSNLTVSCRKGSVADLYCMDNGIAVEYL